MRSMKSSRFKDKKQKSHRSIKLKVGDRVKIIDGVL